MRIVSPSSAAMAKNACKELLAEVFSAEAPEVRGHETPEVIREQYYPEWKENDGMKIYLDNCCFNRPFDDQAHMRIRLETEAKLYIQAGIRARRYTLVWSYILDIENSNNPYDEKRKSIASWKKIAHSHCPASDDIVTAGRKIMEHGIKAKDALHLACAIKHGCEYFITTDDRLANKTLTEINILNPIDFIRNTEEQP